MKMQSIAPVEIQLPEPISVNNLFANRPGRGRVKSASYNAWTRRANDLLLTQGRLPRVFGPCCLDFRVGEHRVGLMDTDNPLKAYIDLLVRAGVIENDTRKIVRRISIEWVEGKQGGVVRIYPASIRMDHVPVVGVVS